MPLPSIFPYQELQTRAWVQTNFHPAIAPNTITVSGYATAGDTFEPYTLYYYGTSAPPHTGSLSILLADGSTTVWYAVQSSVVRVEWFGPVTWGGTTQPSGAAMTANTAAINNAILYFGNWTSGGPGGQPESAGKVLAHGYYWINGTINIANSAILEGCGWGTSYNLGVWGNSQSTIRWGGSAGVSMILVESAYGGFIRDLRIVGNSTNVPRCGLQVAQHITSWSNLGDFSRYDNLYFGQIGGYDTDLIPQFVDCVWVSGTVDGDPITFNNLQVSGASNAGFNMDNEQSGVLFSTFECHSCLHGIQSSGSISGDFFYFSVGSDGTGFTGVIGYALVCSADSVGGISNSIFNLNNVYIETGLLWKMSYPQSQIKITQGVASIRNDQSDVTSGNVISMGNYAYGWVIDLTNFILQMSSQGTTATPHPLVANFATDNGGIVGQSYVKGLLRLDNSFYPDQCNFGTPYYFNDPMIPPIVIREPLSGKAGGQAHQVVYQAYQYGPGGNGTNTGENVYQTWRNDFPGKLNVWGGNLNVRKIPIPQGASVTPTGVSAAQTYAYRVTACSYSDGATPFESLPCTEVTCTNVVVGSLNSTTNYNTVGWYQVLGAYAYRVYGRTSGAELLMATVPATLANTNLGASGSFQWVDNGSVTPSGALPTINKTGSVYIEGTATSFGVQDASSAVAGTLGEYISSSVASGSSVALTSPNPSNVTSISLTAGDWDVQGNVAFNPAGTTTTTIQKGWISATSATDPGPPNSGAYASIQSPTASSVGVTLGVLSIPRTRISISSTTTIYLSGAATFAVSTNGIYGFIGARRVR